MAAISKHPIDVEQWLGKVIDSCITHIQVLSAKKIVRRYQKVYPYKKIFDRMYFVHLYLEDYCDRKFDELISKKIEDDNSSKNLQRTRE